MKRFQLYLKLFLSTLYLSAFTFGGGYIIVPLLKKKFVDNLRWIDENEMLDLMAIGQSAPGPIAVNTSVLVGFKIGGILGAVVTLLGTALPPLLVMSVISIIYEMVIENQGIAAIMAGMNAGVAAVILAAVIQMAKDIFKKKSVIAIILFFVSFMVSYFFEINAVYILLSAAICGLIITMTEYYYKGKGGKDKWSI